MLETRAITSKVKPTVTLDQVGKVGKIRFIILTDMTLLDVVSERLKDSA